MRISRIEMNNVATLASVSVGLPSRGVVLVLGANGAGKSTMVEAVVAAVWGESLRGRAPWVVGKQGSVTVRTHDGLSVTRTRGRKSALSFAQGDAPATQHDTATKTQAALDALVEPFDTWRRISVFSSSDAAHFTLASDVERKRFVERVLGLARLDAAMALAVKAHRDAHREWSEANARATKLAHVAEALGAAARQHAATERDNIEQLRADAAATKVRAQGAKEALRVLDERLLELHTRVDEVNDSMKPALDEFVQAKRLHDEAAKLATCPTCTRPMDAAHVEALRQRKRAARRKLEALEEAANAAAAPLEVEIDVVSAQHRAARDAHLSARDAHVRAAAALQAAEQRAKNTASAASAVDALEDEAVAVQAEVAARQREEEAEAVRQLLSPAGVRAHLVERALAAITAAANGWLGQLGGGLSVTLAPYSATAAGDHRDAISLTINGAGGGFGYAAASAGERRRVDLALMLALADVAEGSTKHPGGTMFFDEVFDALDPGGVTAVCELLTTLAETRCVVVISHSAELVRELRPAATAVLLVQGGTVHGT